MLHVVEYDSNNSGGGWWLNDEDWDALEKAGWFVAWKNEGSEMFYRRVAHALYERNSPNLAKKFEQRADELKGYDRDEFVGLDNEGRWLGAKATSALLIVDAVNGLYAMEKAVTDWEEKTGQYADDPGCSCCGQPHMFSSRGSEEEPDKTDYRW